MALEHLEMELDIAKQLGDKEREGMAHAHLGLCYYSVGEYDKAFKHHKMHLDIAKQRGDKAGEGMAFCSLGLCYDCIGEDDKAFEHHKLHLDIVKQIGDKAGEGMANCNIGLYYHVIGEYDMAFEHHTIHLDIAKHLEDKAGEGMAYGNLGNCYYSTGEYDKAFEHHKKDLDIATELEDKAGEGMAYRNLGVCYFSIGEYAKALEHHKMDLDIAKQLGDKAGEEKAYRNLGVCYNSIGDYAKALEHYEMDLDIAKHLGDKAGEGKAHGNLGLYYDSMGDYAKALKHHKIDLDIANQLGDTAGEGMAYGRLGLCYRSIGEYDKAFEHHKMRLDIAKQLGDKAGEGKAYGTLGTCYDSTGEYGKGLEHHKVHLDIAQQLGDEEGEGTAHHNLGCCYESVGQYENTEHHGKKSLECFEGLFEHSPKEDQFRISIRETFVSTHRLLIRSLLLQGKSDEALVIAERGRARALTYMMSNNNTRQFASLAKSNVLDLCEIREIVKALDTTVLFCTVNKLNMVIWVIPPSGDVAFKETTMHVSSQAGVDSKNPFVLYLQSKVRNAREFLTSSRSDKCEGRLLSCLNQEEEEVSKQIQSNPNPLLADTATSPDDTDPESVIPRSERLVSSSPLKTEKVCQTRIADKLPEAERALLQQLYQTIMEPVRQLVEGPRVVIVPDGPLPLVPFAALVDENGLYVAESLQISLMPSLAIAKMIRAYPTEPEGQTRRYLIVGDPHVQPFQDADGKIKAPSRLPCAMKEAKMIGEVLNSEPLVAEKATKETVLQRIESASVIHIAAHGDMNKGEIVLAPNSTIPKENLRKEDVMLTIFDLERKRLKATLVVLSCCHSGQGEVKAEGVIGIGRAFLGAGACAVVVSLWVLDDGVALCFMGEFYKHLVAGERANEALNSAMETMRDHESCWHPYYWAPFVLIGDDVTPFPRQVKGMNRQRFSNRHFQHQKWLHESDPKHATLRSSYCTGIIYIKYQW